MMKKEMTLSEVKKEIKALGYKVRVKSYNEFKAITVLDPETDTVINGGNVLTAEHLEQYKKYYDWKNAEDRSIHDGNFRCVL